MLCCFNLRISKEGTPHLEILPSVRPLRLIFLTEQNNLNARFFRILCSQDFIDVGKPIFHILNPFRCINVIGRLKPGRYHGGHRGVELLSKERSDCPTPKGKIYYSRPAGVCIGPCSSYSTLAIIGTRWVLEGDTPVVFSC